MTIALGKLKHIPLMCQCCVVVVSLCSYFFSIIFFCCYHRATFDRIAEININIDAGHDSVSIFVNFMQIYAQLCFMKFYFYVVGC